MLGPLREASPRRIGPYEILARLGGGGMGEVFLGRPHGGPAAGSGRPGTDGVVAVKTVRRDLARDDAFRARFRRELAVAGAVRSPYIAPLVDGDADAEPPWLATAYVPGPTLSAAVRRHGPLPEETVRAFGGHLARALRDLHAAGIVHRDLKPGNVLLDLDGPRLIDFGIARPQGATTMTATGMMVGTPGFMSPEHVAGGRRVREPSDVFCLASLLCYAATGEDPFGDGPVPAVLHRVATADAGLEGVPDGLRAVLEECLTPEPEHRPTAAALVARLAPAAETGGAADGASAEGTGDTAPVGWPEAVRAHIGEFRREVTQVCAAGTPLLPVGQAPAPVRTPTAVPGAPAAPLHQLPTMGAAQPAPPSAAADPPVRRRGRRYALLAAGLATVLAVGGGGYLLYGGEDGGNGGRRTGGPRGGGEPVADGGGAAVPGVDDQGTADTSGTLPRSDARPADWKPWKAEFGGPVMGCSAGPTVLACRRTDGSYEVRDTADGRRLWTADLVRDSPLKTIKIGPTGGVFVPGGSTEPTVHGDAVVFVSEGRLQVRDARSGKVRWEDEALGAQGFGSRPLVADGTVLAATEISRTGLGRTIGFAAHRLSDGTKLWSKTLTNTELAKAELRSFEPLAAAHGLVYALSEEGIVGYELDSGKQRGQVPEEAQDCNGVLVRKDAAYCPVRTYDERADYTDLPELVLHRLGARTLDPRGTVPLPDEVRKAGPEVTAVDDRVVAAFSSERARLTLHDRRTGARLGRYGLDRPTGAERAETTSAPLIVGDAVLYADNSVLHVVPVGRDGAPGRPREVPVEGAPGDRPLPAYERADGLDMAKERRPPTVLPVGGVVHLVYDHGAVVSLELP